MATKQQYKTERSQASFFVTGKEYNILMTLYSLPVTKNDIITYKLHLWNQIQKNIETKGAWQVVISGVA